MEDNRTSSPSYDSEKEGGDSPRKAEERIKNLKAKARMGGWGLLTFVIISVISIPNSNFIPTLSEPVRRFLGAPPPANLISVALIVYAFSALTLILARIAQGSGIYKGWSHLFYITAFYIFFGFAQTLRQTYWAVFVTGLVIMGLENFLIRTYSAEEIRKEERRLELEKFKGS